MEIVWADCECNRIFHIKHFEVLMMLSLIECTHIVRIVTVPLAWMSLVKAASATKNTIPYVCERVPTVCLELHSPDLCPAQSLSPESPHHIALSIPWFLEHTSSSSKYSLFGALIRPGDRAPSWLQAIHCLRAANNKGVCLLLVWKVGLWLPSALSNLWDERISICGISTIYSSLIHLTGSSVLTNQNLASWIVSNTSTCNCRLPWRFPSLHVTLGDPPNYLANA